MMMNIERVEKLLKNLGFDTRMAKTEAGENCVTATLTTKKGNVHIFAVPGGARISKPNGTVKFHYEVSEGQFAKYVKQTLAANM